MATTTVETEGLSTALSDKLKRKTLRVMLMNLDTNRKTVLKQAFSRLTEPKHQQLPMMSDARISIQTSSVMQSSSQAKFYSPIKSSEENSTVHQ